MEDSCVKCKCAGYLGLLAFLLVATTVSFTWTARLHSTDRITIDAEEVCKGIKGDVCTNVADTESCLEAANDRQACIAQVSLWEEEFNSKCEWEIADYLACKTQSACNTTTAILETCEEAVSRPEWFRLPSLPKPTWLKDSAATQP